MGYQKILVPIKKGSKNICSKKKLGHQKFWAIKIIVNFKKNLVQKNLRQQKLLVQKILGPKI